MSELLGLGTLCPEEHQRNPYNMLVFKQQLMARFGLEEGFRVYQALVSPGGAPLESMPLESLRAHAERSANRFIETAPAGKPFVVTPPFVIGPSNHRPLAGTTRSQFVACLTDALVCGRSAIVRARSEALLDYEGSEFDSLDDQLELDPTIFYASGKTAFFIAHNETALEVDEAFGSLLGPHSDAFGHWMWEYLPKYVSAAMSGDMPAVPVLIDNCMPATHRQALELLLPEGTQIIEIPAGVPVHVQKLWCAPSLMYMPLLERINERYPGPDFLASPPDRALTVLKEMKKRAEVVAKATTGGERVFLARREHLRRKLLNASEISSLLSSRGFQIVYSEDYDFIEQIQVVNAAGFIVGPEGSAMFLNFFTKPGTRLCILSHPHTIELPAYTALLEAIGEDVTLFTGPSVNSNDSPEYPYFGSQHYADYIVDTQAFSHFLTDWLS